MCADCNPCPHGKGKYSCAACNSARASSKKRIKREPESSPEVKRERSSSPEIKQEPEVKQEPFTIQDYFGFDR
jgi:hypothetical protein